MSLRIQPLVRLLEILFWKLQPQIRHGWARCGIRIRHKLIFEILLTRRPWSRLNHSILLVGTKQPKMSGISTKPSNRTMKWNKKAKAVDNKKLKRKCIWQLILPNLWERSKKICPNSHLTNSATPSKKHQ